MEYVYVKRMGRIIASLFAGGVMAIGSLTLAPAGAASAAACPNLQRTAVTIPAAAPILLQVEGPIARAWSINNVLVDFDATTCFYLGDAFAVAAETRILHRLGEWGYAHPLDL